MPGVLVPIPAPRERGVLVLGAAPVPAQGHLAGGSLWVSTPSSGAAASSLPPLPRTHPVLPGPLDWGQGPPCRAMPCHAAAACVPASGSAGHGTCAGSVPRTRGGKWDRRSEKGNMLARRDEQRGQPCPWALHLLSILGLCSVFPGKRVGTVPPAPGTGGRYHQRNLVTGCGAQSEHPQLPLASRHGAEGKRVSALSGLGLQWVGLGCAGTNGAHRDPFTHRGPAGGMPVGMCGQGCSEPWISTNSAGS